MADRAAPERNLDEAETTRQLSWLSWNMRKHGKSVFLLEDLQPSWLVPSSRSYFFVADTLLGLAIALISAPIAVVIESVFAPGGDASSAIFAALVTGVVVGWLMHMLSYSQHQSLEVERAAARRAADEAQSQSATSNGTRNKPPPVPVVPTPTTTWGCAPALSFIGVFVAGVLAAVNFLQSEEFALGLGRGRLLAVFFVLLVFLLHRVMEPPGSRSHFIRTAETLGVSWKAGLWSGLIALLVGGIITFVAARLLDGWFGNRGVLDIGLNGKAPRIGGSEEVGGFLFSLSVPGRSLFAFLWAAVVVTTATLGCLRPRVVELKTRPNEGMLLSIRNAARGFVVVGVPVALVTVALLMFLPNALDRSAVPVFRGTKAQMTVARERALRWVSTTPPPGSQGESVRRSIVDARVRFELSDTIKAQFRQQVIGITVRDLLQSVARQPGVLRNPAKLSREQAGLLRQLQAYGVFDDSSRIMSPAAPKGSTRIPFGIALMFGLTLGGAAGGIGFLLLGGMGVIRHYVLRLFLAKRRLIPLDYVAFLDVAATELGFMQKVGGGYVFMHRYLLEHFANMSVEVGVLQETNLKQADGKWHDVPIVAGNSLKSLELANAAMTSDDQKSLAQLEVSGVIWQQKPVRVRVFEYGDESSEVMCESSWCRGRRAIVPNDSMRAERWVFRPDPVATDEECDAANRARAEIRCPRCGWHPSPVNTWGCGKCGERWDTFATRAVCPRCGTSDAVTQCLNCRGSSPHVDWYVEGAVVRTLSPDDFEDRLI